MVTAGPDQGPRVLIIVQNLPVPFDRRVWLECQTLTRAGYQVSVVCPKAKGDPAYQVVDGVELYKYRPYTASSGKVTFAAEYAYSFAATWWLTWRASRAGRFTVIQSCNPPDIFWLIGVFFRLLHRSRFVFDHHDLCPELYESRFPNGPRVLGSLLRLLERATIQTADHVIVTNDSYRAVALQRGGADPDRVTVVRTGPDPNRLKRTASVPALRRGRPHLAVYLGVMGPQDGVDIVLRVADLVTRGLARDDISFTLIGSGDCFEELVELRDRLGLGDVVELTGRLPDDRVAEILSTADVGISPDPKNPLNDVSTMNKTMEYMAFSLPVVAFDLRETRVSAAGAAAYAQPNQVEDLARLLLELIDDQPRRESMGRAGRRRVEEVLAWSHQADRYLEVYDRLTERSRFSRRAA